MTAETRAGAAGKAPETVWLVAADDDSGLYWAVHPDWVGEGEYSQLRPFPATQYVRVGGVPAEIREALTLLREINVGGLQRGGLEAAADRVYRAMAKLERFGSLAAADARGSAV